MAAELFACREARLHHRVLRAAAAPPRIWRGPAHLPSTAKLVIRSGSCAPWRERLAGGSTCCPAAGLQEAGRAGLRQCRLTKMIVGVPHADPALPRCVPRGARRADPSVGQRLAPRLRTADASAAAAEALLRAEIGGGRPIVARLNLKPG